MLRGVNVFHVDPRAKIKMSVAAFVASLNAQLIEWHNRVYIEYLRREESMNTQVATSVAHFGGY